MRYNVEPQRAIKATLAASLSVVALAGCGSGSKNSQSIPNCGDKLTHPKIVNNQDGLIAAYEDAGQRLALDYKTTTGVARKRFAIAFTQLFDTTNTGKGLFHSIDTPSTNQIGPDAYLADDPSELMCEFKTPDGTEQTALSVEAIQAEVILADAGTPVHGLKNLTDSR